MALSFIKRRHIKGWGVVPRNVAFPYPHPRASKNKWLPNVKFVDFIITIRLVSAIGNVRTTVGVVGIYMQNRALEHLIFFRPFVGQEINSTPKLLAWGWFWRFPVPFVQSGNCFEIPFIGFPWERGGNCILYTACNELFKKNNNKENNVTLCYRTIHRRRDIR